MPTPPDYDNYKVHLILRQTGVDAKHAPLSNYEVDSNFINLKDAVERIPVSGNWWNSGIVRVNSLGVSDIGNELNFHSTNTTTDYDVRLHTSSESVLNFYSRTADFSSVKFDFSTGYYAFNSGNHEDNPASGGLSFRSAIVASTHPNSGGEYSYIHQVSEHGGMSLVSIYNSVDSNPGILLTSIKDGNGQSSFESGSIHLNSYRLDSSGNNTPKDFNDNILTISNNGVNLFVVKGDGKLYRTGLTSIANDDEIVTKQYVDQKVAGGGAYRNFDRGVNSPTPDQFPQNSLSGFTAYSSTDFPANYYCGVTISGPDKTMSGQIALGWNSEESAPSDFYFRVNDDSSNLTSWSAWSRLPTVEYVTNNYYDKTYVDNTLATKTYVDSIATADYKLSNVIGETNYSNASITTISKTFNSGVSQVFDQFYTNKFKSVKYLVQTVSNTNFHVVELLLAHNGTECYINEYGIVNDNGALITITAQIDAGVCYVNVTPTTNDTLTVKAMRSGIFLDTMLPVDGTGKVLNDVPPSSISLTGALFDTITLTTLSSEQLVLDSVSATDYRSVRYSIQATSGSSYHITEFVVVHDGTSTFNTEYGTIFTGDMLFNLESDIFEGNLRCLVTPATSSPITFKVVKEAIVI